mgnify:CR=1 FL=1
MRRIFHLIIYLLVSGSTFAVEPEVVRRWVFDSPGSAAGWVAVHDMANVRVEGGRLRLELTGPDAYMTSPVFDVPLDGISVGLRLRGDRPGMTEVFWATRGAPVYDGGRRVVAATPARSAAAAGEDDAVTVEVPIGRPAEADETLIGIRIDPYNGNTAGAVAITSIEILRLLAVYEASFAPSSCRWIIWPARRTNW